MGKLEKQATKNFIHSNFNHCLSLESCLMQVNKKNSANSETTP